MKLRVRSKPLGELKALARKWVRRRAVTAPTFHKWFKEISQVSHHELPDKQDSQILPEVGLIWKCCIAENNKKTGTNYIIMSYREWYLMITN